MYSVCSVDVDSSVQIGSYFWVREIENVANYKLKKTLADESSFFHMLYHCICW